MNNCQTLLEQVESMDETSEGEPECEPILVRHQYGLALQFALGGIVRGPAVPRTSDNPVTEGMAVE